MPEPVRLARSCSWIDVEFVERDRTPKSIMELGILLHLSGLSRSNTTEIIAALGVDRSKKAVHDWVHKADYESPYDREIEEVALDETVVKIDGEQYWLFTADDPATNQILLTQLNTARTTVVTEWFLRDLRDLHDVEAATFLVDRGQWLHAELDEHDLDYRHETHGERNAIERIYTQVKRRTPLFENTFRHADPGTAETWLQAHAARLNSRN